MSLSKFLAVDIGAESGRAFVGILNDGKVSIDEIHRFPNTPISRAGHLHWDIFALFNEIKHAMKLAAVKGHADIRSMAVDTWGVDFGLLSTQGDMMDLPFTYRDDRTNGMMQKVFEKISSDDIYSRTGVQFMQINSVYQLYSMKVHDADVFERYDKLLFTPDIFNFFLTGEKISEYTIASTSQLLNAESKTFDREILSSLGMPLRLMCPVVMPGKVIGRLREDIAKETGLRNVEVIAVGSHDTASAVAAVPAAGENWAYLSSGTWSLLGVETEKPVISAASRKYNFTNEGGVGGRITFLKNIMGLWLLQGLRREWESEGESYTYDELMTMAAKSPEFKCLLRVTEDSFLNPPVMSHAILDFCKKTGQACPETKGGMIRSVLESLAFSYRSTLARLAEITGVQITKLHIVGGGSRNGMLNQLTADAAGIPVSAGPVEATTLGNILVQAMAIGKISSLENLRQVVARSFDLKSYQPVNTRKWDEAYNNAAFDF